MRSSQSFGIHFTIRADKVREGKAPVYACVTVNRVRSYIALKQLVEVKCWDNAKGALKGSREEFKYQQLLAGGQDGNRNLLPAAKS